MVSSYDQAVQALYQAPHETFVVERQRLSAELKARNEKASAARVAKLARPTLSAWVVNQLWWYSRAAFHELFETAAALRAGKLGLSGAHRKAIAKLVALAEKQLTEGGHAATEATLRRVSMTLSGLAAAGGFEPEAAGALTKDRDPPGFEAFGMASLGDATPPAAEAPHGNERRPQAARERKDLAAERSREAEAAQKKRIREARAKSEADRRRLEAALRAAKAELLAREYDQQKAAAELAAAARELERARSALEAAEGALKAHENSR
jgi:hypothetical protein